MIHLLLFIFMPIGSAFIHYFLHNKISKYIITLTQAMMLISIMYMIITLDRDAVRANALLNIPLPYGMALELDYIALIFITLNVVLFTTMLLFAMQKPYFKPSFGLIFLSLEGILNAIFLSTDLFNVYVLLEITTVLATLLIMSQSENKSVYHALMYLMTNLVSMAFFLLGIGYLYKITGFLDFKHIEIALSSLEDLRQLNLPFAFLFTGISLKAAVFPLFSWLPKAHAAPSAPSVVSAVLSGIMVKSGIYVLIRLQMLFGAYLPIAELILVLGYATSITGFIMAISQNHIKMILAYHTVSQMGLILIGLGYEDLYTLNGALYHVMSHGLFKPLLFLIAGILINHFHTHEIKDMHGLWSTSKPLSAMLLIAIFSITGAPFFSGSVSKSLIGGAAPSWAMMILSAGTMISFIKFINVLKPMKKPPSHSIKGGLDLKLEQWIALGTLSGLCLLLGLFSGPLSSLFLDLYYKKQLIDLVTGGLEYILLFSFCIILYKLWLSKSRILTALRQIDVTFNQSSIAIMIFFASVLAYLVK